VDVRIAGKPLTALMETRLLQQTSFWSDVKNRQGWKTLAFDLEADSAPSGDVLILLRDAGGGRSVAYSPFGPEHLPDGERRGEYLAGISSELARTLGSECIYIRWDLPWISPYAEDPRRFDERGWWLGPPEPHLRELRMNAFTGAGLRKAPTDILPPDTFMVDLRPSRDGLLSRMKPKTRYNIGLSARRGVTVREGTKEDLDTWQKLYNLTARRNGIRPHGARYFEALLGEPGNAGTPRTRLLLAEKDGLPLAAMFLSVSADRATYLYGASSGERKELMAPYALQWDAMCRAKDEACTSYDMFGASPRPDPGHPLHGLFLFKSGFGGAMIHRQGAWDFPYDREAYSAIRAHEAVEGHFHIGGLR
jgi:lipid II:glycine glycyltransferase (peptidoglycan interpeptide bridge formation enzyme)